VGNISETDLNGLFYCYKKEVNIVKNVGDVLINPRYKYYFAQGLRGES
jgi:hypothetical protein